MPRLDSVADWRSIHMCIGEKRSLFVTMIGGLSVSVVAVSSAAMLHPGASYASDAGERTIAFAPD